MRYKRLLNQGMLLALLLLSISIVLFSGCATPQTSLHPILGEDISSVKKGESIYAPKDGWFFSDEYVEQVMQVKINKVGKSRLGGTSLGS